MQEVGEPTQQALDHICTLSERIGGRGSCTANERRAAEYAAEQMRALGVQRVQIEPVHGARSTYWPFVVALATALLGTLVVWLFPDRAALGGGAFLSGLGAWGMLAETDLADSWMRYLLPRGKSQNAVGVIPAAGEAKHRAVLCAHLDTHRTPVFYSSKTWYLLFGLLVAAAFVSMAVAALAYALGDVFDQSWVRWIGLPAAAMELFALGMCLHADFTPFSPGANDDASGVGVILDLAQRLVESPLAHTEVWLAFTGCEEVGAYGMAAFLNAHAEELGKETVYVILDQVGLGRIRYLTADGLIRKHKTHPRALELARAAAHARPELRVHGHVGLAYTDALVATQRGLIALTLDALPPSSAAETLHWHRMSDTLAHVEPHALDDAHTFTWQVLHEIDAGPDASNSASPT